MKIRIASAKGYQYTHRVSGHHTYPQGDYRVPQDMPADIAQHCLDSGCGAEIRTKADKPETKAAPTNPGMKFDAKGNRIAPVKKKRSRKKTGKKP